MRQEEKRVLWEEGRRRREERRGAKVKRGRVPEEEGEGGKEGEGEGEAKRAKVQETETEMEVEEGQAGAQEAKVCCASFLCFSRLALVDRSEGRQGVRLKDGARA